MDRFGLAPRERPEEVPEGNACCYGFKPVAEYWEQQTAAEEEVQRQTLAKLVETADELARVKDSLTGSQKDLTDTKNALAEAQGDLDAARALLEEMEAELKTTREGLYRRERQAAETRWNFAAKHQKLDAFKEKLQFQGDLRKQLLSKVQTQRKSLILEIEEERQAQLIAAEERLHDVEKLKASHAEQLAQLEASSQSALADLQAASQRRAEQLAQLEASSRTALTDLQAASQRRMGEARSAFASKVDELLALLREDLDDARADAQLAGGVLTGGAHPAVERMKARQAAAAKAAAEATGEAAAAPRGSTAIVPSEVAGGQKAAVAAIEADAAAAAAAFAKIDKDGSGAITRIEVIQAAKRDSDLRTMLGLPAAIKQEDGSREALEALFARMQGDGEATEKQVTLPDFLRVFGPPGADAGPPAVKQAPLLLTAGGEGLSDAASLPPPGGKMSSAEAIAAFGERLGALGTPPPMMTADSMSGMPKDELEEEKI